jgi:hypothetical protein
VTSRRRWLTGCSLAVVVALGAAPARPAVSLAPEPLLAVAAASPLPARGDTTTTLPDAAAQADSVDAFWRGIDARWLEPLDDGLLGFGLDPTRLDSLVERGDLELDALAAGRLWKFRFDPWSRTTFNRVQGATVGAGIDLRIAGPDRPRFSAGAAYRFGTRRPLFDAHLRWPLIVRHHWLPRGLGRGAPYQLLRLELEGYQTVRLFGGDNRRKMRAFTAAVYGADPNQYYEAWGGRLGLRVDSGIGLVLRGSAAWEEQRALSVTTEFNLFNWSLSPPGNVQAADLRDRTLRLGASYQTRGDWLAVGGSVGWHRVDDSRWLTSLPGAPAERDFVRVRSWARIDWLTGGGHRILLAGHYRSLDRPAPPQWKTYLGDYGTLRGYPHAELVGDRGAWASLDVRWGFDLWRALNVPILADLRLQPLTFIDWGRTWDHAGGGPAPEAIGWRMDAGFGFGKLVGIPGMNGNLRLYVGRPVLDGVGKDWRVLLAFGN